MSIQEQLDDALDILLIKDLRILIFNYFRKCSHCLDIQFIDKKSKTCQKLNCKETVCENCINIMVRCQNCLEVMCYLHVYKIQICRFCKKHLCNDENRSLYRNCKMIKTDKGYECNEKDYTCYHYSQKLTKSVICVSNA